MARGRRRSSLCGDPGKPGSEAHAAAFRRVSALAGQGSPVLISPDRECDARIHGNPSTGTSGQSTSSTQCHRDLTLHENVTAHRSNEYGSHIPGVTGPTASDPAPVTGPKGRTRFSRSTRPEEENELEAIHSVQVRVWEAGAGWLVLARPRRVELARDSTKCGHQPQGLEGLEPHHSTRRPDHPPPIDASRRPQLHRDGRKLSIAP